MLGTRKESSASVEWKTNHQKKSFCAFFGKMLWLHCWALSSIVRKQIVMWWWYFTWVPWTWQASGTFDGRQADGQRAWQGVPISWWLCWQAGSQPLAGFVDSPCSLTWHWFTYPIDCLTSCTFLMVEWQNTTCPSIFFWDLSHISKLLNKQSISHAGPKQRSSITGQNFIYIISNHPLICHSIWFYLHHQPNISYFLSRSSYRSSAAMHWDRSLSYLQGHLELEGLLEISFKYH